MLQKSIRKDVIGEYEAKLVAGLSKRKLIALGAACTVGVGVSLLLGACWQLDPMASGYAGVFMTLPIWYLGFFKPNDMQPEAFLPLWVEERFGAHELPYVSECADELSAHAEKAREDVRAKEGRHSARAWSREWLSKPASRRGCRLKRRIWEAGRELARIERVCAQGEARGAQGG